MHAGGLRGGWGERKGVRASNHQEAFPEPAESVSPWSVGSSNEEIDDHPITHVETMLHCPVVGGGGVNKAGKFVKMLRQEVRAISLQGQNPTLVSFSPGTHSSPFKAVALLFNGRKSQ